MRRTPELVVPEATASPTAVLELPDAWLPLPTAVLKPPLALLLKPIAVAFIALASAMKPTAVAFDCPRAGRSCHGALADRSRSAVVGGAAGRGALAEGGRIATRRTCTLADDSGGRAGSRRDSRSTAIDVVPEAFAVLPMATLPVEPTEALTPYTEALVLPLSVAPGPVTVAFAAETAPLPIAIALTPFAVVPLPKAMALVDPAVVPPTLAPLPMAMPLVERGLRRRRRCPRRCSYCRQSRLNLRRELAYPNQMPRCSCRSRRLPYHKPNYWCRRRNCSRRMPKCCCQPAVALSPKAELPIRWHD